jgi:hypothetical protein
MIRREFIMLLGGAAGRVEYLGSRFCAAICRARLDGRPHCHNRVSLGGRAHREEWALDYEPEEPLQIEPLMGWTASGDRCGCVSIPPRRRLPIVSEAQTRLGGLANPL